MGWSTLKRPSDTRASQALCTNVQYVRGVGPQYARLIARLGIETVHDLLYHKPRGWQDRTQIMPISSAAQGESAMFAGTVTDARLKKMRRRGSLLDALIDDSTGQMALTWFNQPYIAEKIRVGDRVLAWGRVTSYQGLPQIVSPEFETIDDEGDEAGGPHQGIVPVYPLTEGVTNRRMRFIISNCLEKYSSSLEDFLDAAIIEKRRLVPLSQAIRHLHFPPSEKARLRALRRLKFDELFLFEAAMALRRENITRAGGAPEIKITERIDARIRRLFDFTLTPDQDAVIRDLAADLASTAPMNRLLQGDVGSGKTAIAIYAMLSAVAARSQAALMAPTGILAEQHYRTLSKLLREARVRFELLTGGTPPAEKTRIRRLAAAGELDILIGTHSLIQESVDFSRLGLVVMDEQHKFGVLQRARLKSKGTSPHSLVMTATPIPRTLTLTVFGDLDVSVIATGPPGRKQVSTRWVRPEQREEAFEFIRKKLSEGRQAFFVYPLIEGSEKSDVRSAVETAQELKELYREFTVEVVTGAMDSPSRESAMNEFRSGRAHILVATVVIEVGIDIPNASIMVIENAERFGLSQLHQLRGRIGRGRHRSWCLLFGEPATEEARSRLEIMSETSDGFRIAEEDLRLRGPGEFFGTRQHGLPEFKFADIIEDWKLLIAAREDAFAMVEADPGLARHARFKERVLESCRGRLDLVETG